MISVADVREFMASFAPCDLAEDWDNVGLLVGDVQATVERIMTCLTVTPESAEEAIRRRADLIVTHHPIPFRAIRRLTTDDVTGQLLLRLIRANIAIISPHTAFDSAETGINQMLADRFELQNARPLVPACQPHEGLGAARIATAAVATSLPDLLAQAKSVFELNTVRYVGDLDHQVQSVALACGSGGSFLEQAIVAKCDTLITGEATFHTCLAARASGVALILLGHHTSERFAVEVLADVLAGQFSGVEVWTSDDEFDPICYA
jgi:dinuclear metal center YbgI/SA1388 family protein